MVWAEVSLRERECAMRVKRGYEERRVVSSLKRESTERTKMGGRVVGVRSLSRTLQWLTRFIRRKKGKRRVQTH